MFTNAVNFHVSSKKNEKNDLISQKLKKSYITVSFVWLGSSYNRLEKITATK